MGSIEARHLIISGVVQGVGFRYHMTREAHRLGITGWVRNLHDGSVEAVIAGSSESVAAIIDWSRRGSPAANVEQALVEEIERSEPFDDFQQRR